jgi:hypothetical protein
LKMVFLLFTDNIQRSKAPQQVTKSIPFFE